ncbi:hypothetical protein IMG5_012480 [Ichthyophthirius multifiliis]|uniref:Acid phosphatase n=1 Tax=Ichthyophthirius multifiliis TaxID=5932 RepID=G0QK39_ICHMU|nr:hypothetical protein IMG5_012480 [Ichthyophthirius multifiliis]EGR34416.1 hypothetical protein IMG5_012480 [Ichthyophthirius multifiliis]|eukprot:XP_004039720.1 hypothetical protein IMG5_012480 [Ichthyophthirius multifiliis]
MFKHLILLYFLYFLIKINTQPSPETTDLKLVIEVFRHGARYSIFQDTFGPKINTQLTGELTPVGMRQQFMLGKALNAEYIQKQNFLNSSYDYNQMFIQSTDFNRTIMSAYSQLAGLYSLNTGPKIFSNLSQSRFELEPAFNERVQQINGDYSLFGGQQPFAIHMNAQEDDQILFSHGNACPQAQNWQNEYQNNTDWKKVREQFRPSLTQFSDYLKTQNKNIQYDQFGTDTYNHFFDTLISLKYQGFNNIIEPLKDIYNDLQFLYNINIQITYFYKEAQRRLTSTKFLQKIKEYMNGKIQGQQSYKWYMISAHDLNILTLLNTFKQTSWECLQKTKENTLKEDVICITQYPEYAASYIFELRVDKNDNKKFYVMTKYNGQYIDIIKKNQKIIPFEDFAQYIDQYSVNDFEKQCKIKARSSNDQSYVPVWSISLMVIFSILFLGTLGYTIYFRIKNKDALVKVNQDYESIQKQMINN